MWPADYKHLKLQVIPGKDNSFVLRGQLNVVDAGNVTRQNAILPGLVTLIGDTWAFHPDTYDTFEFLPSCQTTLGGFQCRSWLNCEVVVTFSRVTGIHACDIHVSEPGGCGSRAFNICFDDEATCRAAIAHCVDHPEVWKIMDMETAQQRSDYSYDSGYWLERQDEWYDGKWVEMDQDGWASNCDADMDFGGGNVVRSRKANPAQLDEFIAELAGVVEHSRQKDGITCDQCFTTSGSFKDFLHCASCPQLLCRYTLSAQMFQLCRACAETSDAVHTHSRQQQLLHGTDQSHRFLDPRDPAQVAVLVNVYQNSAQPPMDSTAASSSGAAENGVVQTVPSPLTAVELQSSPMVALINGDHRVTNWGLLQEAGKPPVLELTQAASLIFSTYYLHRLYEGILCQLFPDRTCQLRVHKADITSVQAAVQDDEVVGDEILGIAPLPSDSGSLSSSS